MVKTHVVRMTAYGAEAASRHLRYIEREGVEADGSRGQMYGAHGPVQREEVEQRRANERHQFRIIISPDDGQELELTEYVRQLMARVERDAGRKLEWVAVNHYNTGHPHAHVVVRGVDRDGQQVRFDRAYISNGMRWRAEGLATELLGPRPEFEIRRARAREVAQERFTSLDRELERRARDGRVHVDRASGQDWSDEATLVARLERLEQMQLAVRCSTVEWQLAAHWKDTLRALGMRGDILKQMHAVLTGDPDRWHAVGVGEQLPDGYGGVQEKPLVGRVAAKGLADELKGTFYVVLETPTGPAYHVPVGGRAADALRVGDLVTFESMPIPAVGSVEQHIAELAQARGGQYEVDPAATTGSLQARANRRLAELARRGLAAQESATTYRVPADLLEQIQRSRGNSPQRRRLIVRKQSLSLSAQVAYRGPTWLDRVDPSSLTPYGFGAEVANAIERRHEVLRGFGIAVEDQHAHRRLFQLERDAVAGQFAKRSGQTFVAEAPTGFRGQAVDFFAPGGAPYAIISDGQRFVVIRTPHARRWRGQTVTLSRDATGRPLIRSVPDRDLGND
jgi:type IV secretory pathway VirD2 relaxase